MLSPDYVLYVQGVGPWWDVSITGINPPGTLTGTVGLAVSPGVPHHLPRPVNLCGAPECSILRVVLSALGMNLALVGEGEDTGFVLFRETLCRAGLATVLPLVVDDLPVGVDLSGTPGQFRLGLGAGLVGDSFVGEGEDASVALKSPTLSMCVCYQEGQAEAENNH